MTRTLKIALSVVAAFLLIIVGILSNAEIRTFLLFKVAPTQARNSVLLRLKRPGNLEIYLLGTIHNEHLKTPDYSLAHIEAVLLHLQPTQLLVESRPEQIAVGNLADGPIEMAYASLVARAEGIAFDGIDWWDASDGSLRRTNATREDRMIDNILQRLPETGTALVLVGFSHIAEFAERLQKLGYEEAVISGEARAALFDTASVSKMFPVGMGEAVEHRIAKDKAMLRNGTHPAGPERAQKALTIRYELLTRIRTLGERPQRP